MARNGDRAGAEAAVLAGMARRAADLGGRVELPAEVAKRTRLVAEKQLGLRCAGCGVRITTGFKFVRVDIVLSEGRPTADVARLYACNGANGCGFAEQAKEGADVVEMVEYAWLVPDPLADPEDPVAPATGAGEVAQSDAEDEAFADAERLRRAG